MKSVKFLGYHPSEANSKAKSRSIRRVVPVGFLNLDAPELIYKQDQLHGLYSAENCVLHVAGSIDFKPERLLPFGTFSLPANHNVQQ